MKMILFGYRACGKSTLGKRLASESWEKLYDTDALVIQAFDGKTIREIWESHGEAAFREKEVEVTRQVCQIKSGVIALGGGTLMEAQAKQAVMDCEDAKKVYMYCQADELYRRLCLDQETGDSRPDLTEQGGLAEVEKMLALRDPIYREVADSVFDVTHLDEEKAYRYLMQNHV